MKTTSKQLRELARNINDVGNGVRAAVCDASASKMGRPVAEARDIHGEELIASETMRKLAGK